MANILKVLDLSTNNLPEDICQDLNSFDGVNAHSTGYGWMLSVPSDPDERIADHPDIPVEIVAVWRYARTLDCHYVRLDSDSDVDDALPSWKH